MTADGAFAPRRLFVVAVVAVAIAAALAAVPSLRPTGLLRDFSAFYCAGASIDAGADPYRAEPLGACERAPRPEAFGRGLPGLATPAPLPPFALAAFAVLARLPFAVAGASWTALLLGAFALSIASLVRLGIRAPVAIVALGLTDGYASLALGQVAPLAVAALLVVAAVLEAGTIATGVRTATLALCVTLALVEPHLALPALVASAVLVPACRLPVALAVAFVAVASTLAVGATTSLEYVRDVLPAHARSEIASTRQFSLTVVLAEFGAPGTVALAIGEASYALATVAGIACGARLAKRHGPAFVVLTPAAFAVAGGPFVHIVQMAAAVPLALVLARRAPETRPALELATAALAVPWIQFASLGGILLPAGAAAVGGGALLAGHRPRLALAGALATLALFAAIEALVGETPPDAVARLVAHADPRALAEASWARYVEIVGGSDRRAYDLARLPTWLAIVTIASAGVVAGFARKGSRVEGRTPSRSEIAPFRKDPS